MSTLKKVISLVLCAAILVGSFALVGSVASAEELSNAPLEGTNIDSYESLVATYGTNVGADGLVDGFVYIGTEILEANGKITDYYVQPGDELTVRTYLKSNMFVGEPYIISLFDNTFFDVKLPAGEAASVDANGYTSNYSGGVRNVNHPMIKQNNSSHTITSININNVGWIKSMCGFTSEYLAGTDLIQSNTQSDITVSQKVYTMESDEWFLSYKVKVKEGLADETKGIIDSPDALWHVATNPNNGKHDARRKAYVPVKHITTEGVTTQQHMGGTAGVMATNLDNGALDHVLLDDMYHEFTIGEGEATKYTATFYAEDQETIVLQNTEYEVGDELEFPASVENQIGWAMVKEGVTAPGTILYPAEDGTYDYIVKEADVEFLRVLTTSRFPVKFGLGQNFLPGKDPVTGGPLYDVTVYEDKLPEGMTFLRDEWLLQIDLPIGQPFDLQQIPDDAVVKAGHEITGWDTSTVAPPSTIEDDTIITLNVVNGAMGTDITVSSKAIWNPELYTVKFYLNEEAYNNGDAPLKVVEGLTFTSTVKYNGVDAETGVSYSIENEILDKKFAGWVDAETGELASAVDSLSLASYGRDLELYANWVDYANSAAFMVRNYETGEWVEAKRYIYRNEVAEGEQAVVTADEVRTALLLSCSDSNVTFRNIYTINPDTITDGNYDDYKLTSIFEATPGVYITTDLNYTGNQVYYIATVYSCNVTWTVPAYDEATNTFDEANATVISEERVATAPYTGAGDPFKTSSKLTQAVPVPTGYALAGWKDAATGELVTLDENGAFVIDTQTKSATLIAVFELVEYPVAFNLRNSDNPDIVMLSGTVTLGGEIVIDSAEFTLNGETSVLPVVGLSNDEQADGGYTLPEGYKFAGWTLGYGSNATPAEFPVVLTAQMIRENFANGAINFNATWEAQEYTLSFYITNQAEEEELFATYTVKAGEDIASYRNVTAEIAAAVNEKAPEGKVFSNIWYNKETDAPDTTLTRMPAKDVSYYAIYTTATIKVYVDYNHLAEKDLAQSMELFKIEGREILLYGADITEVKEEAPYYSRSFETVVMRSPITLKPADASEVIGWSIYHVGAGEDPYTAEWKPGVNDEGTTIANTTLIFQPTWLAHKDMLFRIYDTDGNLAHALGKDFKTYFWDNGKIVESNKDTAINRNTELYLAYILTMSIENWNWDEFFNIEMWQSLTIRFDPFPIPRSWLTWEGFKGILDAIGNALGSLF